MSEPDFSLEEKEESEGYFAKQAGGEFKSIVARMKRDTLKGKLLFLRSIGRKERLLMNSKHGKRWQDALHA